MSMRINKYLARSGVTSRRKAEELVLSGSVFVNGTKVTSLTTEINNSDKVTVNGGLVEPKEKKYYMLNKPTGYTVTKADKYAERTVFELLPKDPSLYSVGRLDKETSGLLLITNDGDFGQNIIHPTKKIEKEYLVITKGKINEDQIRKLSNEIDLEDGPARFVSIKKIAGSKISVVIEEGRNRIVRRMFKEIGNEVKELKRIRIGCIKLDIEEGKYRELSTKEASTYV